MILEHPKDLVWSRERWFMTITITFAVQIIVIIWLSSRETVQVRSESQTVQTQFYPRELSDVFAPLLRVMDPSLYASANAEGFSGDVWLNTKPIGHRSPGWTDKPQFLKFDEQQLLADLEEFGRVAPPRRQPIQVDIARNAQSRFQLSKVLQPEPSTILQIDGQLSRSDLIRQPDLPAIEFNGILAASRIAVQVDQQGRVFSVILVGQSGSPDADRLAMKIARSLRFVKAEGFSPATDANDFRNLRRATVTMRWWTVPVPSVPAEKPMNETPPPKVEPVQ